MRDVLVALAILISLPTCFRRPFVGLVLFSLLAYMRVQDLTWGFAREMRWSYYVALVTLAGFVAQRVDKQFFKPDPRTWIMFALALVIGLGIILSAGSGEFPTFQITNFLKVVAVALFTTGIVRERRQLRVLLWVFALSFGFYGLKSGLAGVLSFGNLTILQGPGGMLADNNDFALALCMALPLLVHLGAAEKNVLLRRALWVLVPFTVLTVVLTYSRGGFLALAVTILVLCWRSRNRLAGLATLGLFALAGLAIAPTKYVERISTIADYQTEGSAQGRLQAWGVAWTMIKDNPVMGVGFNRFQENYARYDPVIVTDEMAEGRTRVAHNSYLQIWAEGGSIAFGLYLLLIVLSFTDLWRLRRRARRRYYSSWILSYTSMLEASMAAFLVGSTFLNRAHFDLFYHYVAVILVFTVLARRQMDAEDAGGAGSGRRGQGAISASSRAPGGGRSSLGGAGLGGPGGRRLVPAHGLRNTPG
ncbi:MAG: putative O-glycosylation ligase, exosortase A system-associated, partial [Planctomycetota bacterium]|nr:putative O-glycosylation ligase, exosortase A system-associated [Planctomycetota bacterium]